MIHWTDKDAKMASHMAEVVGDRIHHDPYGYTAADKAAVDKLDAMGVGNGRALVVTGAELSREDAAGLMQDVVSAEMANWVPGASQRLIGRAARALGFRELDSDTLDCGPNPGDHALYPEWVAGLYVQACSTCARLFRP